MNISFEHLKKLKHLMYLRYIRYRISNIKKIDDIINIMNNICYFNGKLNNDSITEIINSCINLYPLNEKELQLISLIQQEYNNNLGIENYASLILWCSIIYSINDYENVKKLKLE